MFAFEIDFTTNMSLMNTECGYECACKCHQASSASIIKKPKNNKIVRDLGYQNDWNCSDAYYACMRFQDKNRWLPRNMYRAAKRITMDMTTSVKVKNKQQMLLWGQILFYMNSQSENLLPLMFPSGDKSLDYKLVEFYIEKWLKPHRDGIAKRKGLTH
jgi:hypothetical protein